MKAFRGKRVVSLVIAILMVGNIFLQSNESHAIPVISAATADDKMDKITLPSNPNASTLVFRIDRPDPRFPAVHKYPTVKFHPGDDLTVTAGGCVNRQGSGSTRYRYVDPIQGNGQPEWRYRGLIKIPGVTADNRMIPIASILGRKLIVPANADASELFLRLGYDDDTLDDNNYASKESDFGPGDQCKNRPNAWVQIEVHRNTNSSILEPRYNEIQQKASHNSFEQDEPLMDQLIYHRIRSIEFDIHGSSVDGEWGVYHDITSDHSVCRTLSACFELVRAFHNAVPNHEVVTIGLDVKEDFTTPTRGADALDALILKHIPKDKIFTPTMLLARCKQAGTLHEAAIKCGWPTLTELRTKFILFMTASDDNPRLYGGESGTKRESGTKSESLAFLMPDANSTADVDKHQDAVMFNMTDDFLGGKIDDQGFISRNWGHKYKPGPGLTQDWYARSLLNRVHHLATNKINESADPWSTSRNSKGWPFSCMRRSCAEPREQDNIISAIPKSGDIDGDADSFIFRFDEVGAGKEHAWTTFVSAASSYVNDWAKGCLMARESTAAGSPYFAVCRPADNHPQTVQFRLNANEGTTEIQANFIPFDLVTRSIPLLPRLFEIDSAIFMRLMLSADEKCVRAFGSLDGEHWNAITDRVCGFKKPLILQGIAASSHDTEKAVRFMFGNVQNTAAPQKGYYRWSSFAQGKQIGSSANGHFFDGPEGGH